MARPLFRMHDSSRDKARYSPCNYPRRTMGRNRKSRVSRDGVSVEKVDHLVGHYYISSKQTEVRCHLELAGAIRTYHVYTIEISQGNNRILTRPEARSCRTIRSQCSRQQAQSRAVTSPPHFS